MVWWSGWKNLCRNLLNRRRLEEDLDREIQSYFEILIQREVDRGLSCGQARRVVRLRFEGVEQVKEKVREARMGAVIETTFRDFRYALRTMWKSPGFALVAVLTLALGIGGNTAIFTLIDAVMMRSLPVERPSQLVLLTDPASGGVDVDTTQHGIRDLLSYPEFEQLRAYNTAFSGMLAAQSEVSNLDLFPTGGRTSQSIKVRTQLVSGDFFQVLGVQPVLGRAFTPDEDKAPGANPVAVVSYGFWQSQLAADPEILGTTVRVGQGVFQIIGVTPSGFHGILVGSDPDIWFPITMQARVLPGRDYLKPKDTLWLQVMARLAPGMSPQSSESAINVTFQQTLQGWAASLLTEGERRNMLDQRLQLRPGVHGASELRGEFSDPLVLLMAMVGVVLLIACANIANLMLAKANARQREIGVRLALGAARPRLIRQLLTESLLVAFLGGIAGLLFAVIGTRLLVASLAGDVSGLGLETPLDYRVLLFTAAISLVTGLVFGLAPAIRATGHDLNRSIAASGRSLTSGIGRTRSSRILIVAQVALSLVLVTGAALFVRSLHNLLTENLGYNPDHLLMVRVDPVTAGYKGPAVSLLYNQLQEALRTVPGVGNVTLSNTGLFTGDAGDQLSIEGSPVQDKGELHSRWTEVGPDYFRTLGIPLLKGREVESADAAQVTAVCVINESFANRFFPDSDPIGRHITDEYPTTRETFEIIGVAANAKEHLPNETVRPRFYSNLAHPIGTVESVTFLLRSAADPAGVASDVRRAIGRVDASLPIVDLRTIGDQLNRRLIMQRLVAGLAAFFGSVALFMAAIGLYGVMSYSMSQRTTEIGIRMALGASAGSVIRMVVGEALGMVTIGMAIGLPAALIAGRLVSSRLYGLTAADPIAIVTAAAIIFSAALLASYLPALRASRIDPIVSLKYE